VQVVLSLSLLKQSQSKQNKKRKKERKREKAVLETSSLVTVLFFIINRLIVDTILSEFLI